MRGPTARHEKARSAAKLALPEFGLVAIVGDSPAKCETFCQEHFIRDDPVILGEGDWHRHLADRLGRRELAVVAVAGAPLAGLAALLRLAKVHYARPRAILLRSSGPIGKAKRMLASAPFAPADKTESLLTPQRLEQLGFRSVHVVSAADARKIAIDRVPLSCDLRAEHGPFDIIGDVHGCAGELVELLGKLGYVARLYGEGADRRAVVASPPERRAIFVGDFVDRGPRSPDVLRIVLSMVRAGQALAVPGNHDMKFVRWLRGTKVTPSHGLDQTIAQFEHESPAFRDDVRRFIERLPSHLWLEGGRLAVAHAGIMQDMLGRDGGKVKSFCLYGDTDGGVDSFGLAMRYHWALSYRGETAIVYGHTPVSEADWVNNTLCIDTGCCFGGRLTALRWPEREIVSVSAAAAYATRARPFGHPPPRPSAESEITK